MAEVLGVVSSIIAILELGGTIIDYVHKVKSASTDCDRILLQISSTSGFLSSLKELISRAESQDVWLDTVRSLEAPNGPIAQYSSALEQLKHKLNPLMGWRKAGKAIRWPFEKTEVLEILESIERQKTLFILALENDSVNLSLAILADVAGIQKGVSQIQAGINGLEISSQEQRLATIYEWLDPLSGDFEKKQADIFHLRGRQDGASKWLLDTREFVNWESSYGSTLWCSGAPGIGKTVISSFIVDHLAQKYIKMGHVGTVFLYCNYKDAGKQTIRNMIASILHQLVLQTPHSAKNLEDMYQHHRHQGSQPLLSELLICLKKVSREFEKLYIIVDALDEYAQDSLDDLLKSIRGISPRACHFFTSRPNIHITLKDVVHLKIEAHANDIENFLVGRIEESKIISDLVRKDPMLKARIVETITEKAKGMFLLARLHLECLLTKTNLRKLKAALNALPEGQDEAYDELIKRIQSQNADYAELAKKALLWIVNAKRPLKMNEILYALAVEPGDTSLDPEGLSDPGLLVSVCSGIVTFEPESRVVGLVHYTAQEYLNRKNAAMFPDAQREMSLICLTALSFKAALDDYYKMEVQGEEAVQLSRYAVPYWADHMRESPNDPVCEELALNFTCSQGTLAMKTVRLQGSSVLILLEPQDARNSDTGFCVLAALGLEKQLMSHLDQDLRLRARTSEALDCALLFAIFYGHLRTVAFLIEQGANVDYRSGNTETALHYAALKGYEAITGCLLDHQANVNAVADIRPHYAQHLRPSQPHRKWTPLHLASSLGHGDVVQILLRRGAKLDVVDDRGHTPLHLAVVANASTTVLILLEAEVSTTNMLLEPALLGNERSQGSSRSPLVNLTNDKRQTALHLGAVFRSDEAVAQLLKAGAGINTTDSSGNTPLLLAVHGQDPNRSIIQALVEAGADVNAAGRINGLAQNSALHLAVEPTKHDILELLLKHDAKPNARNAAGSTPIHLATSLGSGMKIYESLLDAGADINAQDVNGNTVLHIAVVIDDPSVMEYFLDKGAKAQTKNNEDRTALDVALQWKKIFPCGLGPDDPKSVAGVLRKAMIPLTEHDTGGSQMPLMLDPQRSCS